MGRGSSEQGVDPRFDVVMPARPAALPGCRHAFVDWMAALGVDEDDRSDLAVVFSELVTNAMSATGDSDAAIGARAECTGHDVLLEITNPRRTSTASTRRWDTDDQLRPGGRGLVIVRAFVDEIEVDRAASGAVVIRCRRRVRLEPPDARARRST